MKTRPNGSIDAIKTVPDLKFGILKNHILKVFVCQTAKLSIKLNQIKCSLAVKMFQHV